MCATRYEALPDTPCGGRGSRESRDQVSIVRCWSVHRCLTPPHAAVRSRAPVAKPLLACSGRLHAQTTCQRHERAIAAPCAEGRSARQLNPNHAVRTWVRARRERSAAPYDEEADGCAPLPEAQGRRTSAPDFDAPSGGAFTARRKAAARMRPARSSGVRRWASSTKSTERAGSCRLMRQRSRESSWASCRS